jgi:chemotaxis protein methyltransferase CheR
MPNPISKDVLKFFAAYIERELGIVYSESNFFQLESRLHQIAKQMGKTTDEILVSSYNQIYGDFKNLLLDTATNNETSFFRDKAVFRSLAKNILPEIAEEKGPGQVIRIWSAACSTGQEPYTLAMLLNEEHEAGKIPPFQIVATDYSTRALERAKKGVYSQLEVQRGLPATHLVKYFDQVDDSWKVSSELQRKIEFQHFNLLDKWNILGPFDLIFCRNVLIYQKIEKRKEIIARLADYLTPKGYLVLGATESMMGLSDRFESVLLDGASFNRKKKAAEMIGQGDKGCKSA